MGRCRGDMNSGCKNGDYYGGGGVVWCGLVGVGGWLCGGKGGLHFLKFFNDPRIIRGQRISAYKGYRGGDDVESLGAVLERLWCKVEVDGGGFGSGGVCG
ncbi:hypothetical protein Tco_0290864 [Tanacetum coccineum]